MQQEVKMMPTFLDLRTSQFAPGGTLSTNPAAPTFLGGIGLVVGDATNIRVDLNATVNVSAGSAATITILVCRNLPAATISTFNPGNVIYTTTESVPAGQVNYALFAYSSAADTSLADRVQTLNGIAAAG